MTILQKVLAWTQEIPSWQSDAVARLLVKQELSAEDYEDLLALLKLAHGIADPKNRRPAPLAADQIPTPIEATSHVEVHAMKDLQHVNAIAPNQRILFSPVGISVIYGDNGSGKSGYSRVLKRACRARDQTETIHPNATLPANQIGTPKATFEISVEGVTKEVVWTQGHPAPSELSSLSIFDTRCARAYLDREDDFSYIPYGLDVFEALVKICQRLKASVENEQRQFAVDLTAYKHLHGDTAVGRLIASLSAKTNTAQIVTLATLTQEELSQHELQDKSLRENNPKEKASLLRLRARRVSALATNASSKETKISHETVTTLKELADSYRTAQEAATLAALQFKQGDNLLTGTGGTVWRELFEAARKFAVESHPDHEFPNLGEGTPCPLCQEPLAEGAARLMRFEAFIQEKAERTSQERRLALYAVYKPLVEYDMSLGLDDVSYGELESLDAQLASDTRAFETALTHRRDAIKAAVITHDWSKIGTTLSSPTERLKALAQALHNEAAALEQASDEKARAELQKTFDELDARIRLHQVKDAVVAATERLGHLAKLKACLAALKTTAISNKASELAQEVVSKDLADLLNQEFKMLGVGRLQVTLQSRVDKGKALHKLKLELPQRRAPSEILSEGEQRAIAIGSFLAEVNLSGQKGGVVFDDPVSSLDHRRRERVAKRLALEAAKRQVIVLTHDIYFLCILAEEAKLAGIPIITQSLTRSPEGFGIADPELPFEGRNVSKRIGALKAHQQTIASLYKNGDEQAHLRHTVEAYSRLRMTWERAVEEVLLCDSILRFRKGVETQRLSGVRVEDDDYAKIHAGMAKCSNYVHDKALAGGIAIPDPDELLADINTLDTWRKEVLRRNEATVTKRKPKTAAMPS